MNWVTAIWSMIAAACLTLAVVNLSIWRMRREALGNVLFSLSAAATAAYALCELWLMRTVTAAEYGAALRWLYVPGSAILLCLVGFVLFHLRAGRHWLAWTILGLRVLGSCSTFSRGETSTSPRSPASGPFPSSVSRWRRRRGSRTPGCSCPRRVSPCSCSSSRTPL